MSECGNLEPGADSRCQYTQITFTSFHFENGDVNICKQIIVQVYIHFKTNNIMNLNHV